MEVLALGPMEARVNGRCLPIAGAKQRALLARLLTARGRPVSVARLCDDLATGRALRDPVHALQAQVSRLRSAFPKLEIAQVNGGYRLDHLDVHTDIARFEKLREEGGWLLTEGALHEASGRLQAGLELWRGPAFDDVPHSPALDAEAARLTKLWASALADRVDIDLALGRESEVIPELAATVEENILLERFWGQLMVALYREGQVQEALDAYARAREIFSERFGVEPNGELGRLHLRILQEAPSESLLRLPLMDQSAPSTESSSMRNVERDPSITSNDTESLVASLRQHRALLLTGTAGIGKTHLLRSVHAHLERQRFHAPLLSASALSQSTPLGVFAGAAGFLSGSWKSVADVIDALARQRSTTMLLVDNVDQLDEASLLVVRQLISTARLPALIAARSMTDVPESIRALYDSGELAEVMVNRLGDEEMNQLAVAVAGGPFTPNTRLRLLDAAAGVPRRMREVITGSKAAERLMLTDSGWDLRGDPAPSLRFAQQTGDRFGVLDSKSFDALALIAIAGEYPREAMEQSQRRALARTGALKLSHNGWLCLADPLDREVLRARCSDLLWNELTREAVKVLSSSLAADVPQAQQRAHLLALDLDDPVEVEATLALAERALGAFDERLALRAAEAVIAQERDQGEAHRIAGIATSVLRASDRAESHFEAANLAASSAAQLTRVAIDHAEHHGVRHHDAARALHVIEQALDRVRSGKEVAPLRRARMRWMAVSGMGGETMPAAELPADAAGVMGLIMVAMSGVITGPLDEAHRTLAQLEKLPAEIIDTVPGGRALSALTEAMAVSNSGDFTSAQQLLRSNLAQAEALAPESLGDWEYALGFGELLSGDAVRAHELAVAAVAHLEWRDSTGLLPAAHALRAAASAEITGHGSETRSGFDAVPGMAANDPKVVMMRRWTQARSAHGEGRVGDAADILVETAQWLLGAQHSYFAGMCAHYAVRTGCQQEEALAVLKAAHAVAGGGLLSLLVRHAEVSLSGDWFALDQIAREAHELGLIATAADSWTTVERNSQRGQASDHRRVLIEQLYTAAPRLASWVI